MTAQGEHLLKIRDDGPDIVHLDSPAIRSRRVVGEYYSESSPLNPKNHLHHDGPPRPVRRGSIGESRPLLARFPESRETTEQYPMKTLPERQNLHIGRNRTIGNESSVKSHSFWAQNRGGPERGSDHPQEGTKATFLERTQIHCDTPGPTPFSVYLRCRTEAYRLARRAAISGVPSVLPSSTISTSVSTRENPGFSPNFMDDTLQCFLLIERHHHNGGMGSFPGADAVSSMQRVPCSLDDSRGFGDCGLSNRSTHEYTMNSKLTTLALVLSARSVPPLVGTGDAQAKDKQNRMSITTRT